MAGCDDVASARVERDSIQRSVGLDEPPVLLAIQPGMVAQIPANVNVSGKSVLIVAVAPHAEGSVQA